MQRDSGQALPHALCALSQQLMLAAALRRLLQNDSLLDIGSRRSLYLQLVQLLKHLGTLHPSSSRTLLCLCAKAASQPEQGLLAAAIPQCCIFSKSCRVLQARGASCCRCC